MLVGRGASAAPVQRFVIRRPAQKPECRRAEHSGNNAIHKPPFDSIHRPLEETEKDYADCETAE